MPDSPPRRAGVNRGRNQGAAAEASNAACSNLFNSVTCCEAGLSDSTSNLMSHEEPVSIISL